MSTVRLRRLQSDYEKLQDYTRRHPRVKLLARRVPRRSDISWNTS